MFHLRTLCFSVLQHNSGHSYAGGDSPPTSLLFYPLFITRPNYAMHRSTILCLYVPGFQRQVLKMFQNESGFHKQNFIGFRIQIPVTQTLSAHLFCCGFRNKQI